MAALKKRQYALRQTLDSHAVENVSIYFLGEKQMRELRPEEYARFYEGLRNGLLISCAVWGLLGLLFLVVR